MQSMQVERLHWKKFPKVLRGLGKFKGYQLKFHISQDTHPVAQQVRRIPFSRRAKVSEKLEDLLKLDVIEKVEGPTSCLNPLVVAEKPNGDVRVCLDMRQTNRAIVREKHPVPTVEETFQEVSYAKVLSKLDLNMTFHQIELHPDSRDITTFAAPNSLYRYKRLLFGVNMAMEKFQQIMWQLSRIVPGRTTCTMIFELLVQTTKSTTRTWRVIRQLEESGLTLNYEKCEIEVSSMVYIGGVLSGEGLRFSSDRVKAIVKAPAPQNVFEVRSFLSSVQLCKVYPKLCYNIQRGLKQNETFHEIKDRLVRAPVMAYHRQGAPNRLTTDASPVGIAAILEQKQEDWTYRPIWKRGASCQMGMSEVLLELYVYGIKFEICTDHNPLVTVLGSQSKPPSARIERWLLYLQQLQHELTHIRR